MTTPSSAVAAQTPRARRPNYVAAWLSEASAQRLRDAGVAKTVHLTTFFDGYQQLENLVPYEWAGTKRACVRAVVEWPVGDTLYLIAELECDWSANINAHYTGQGARQDLPHKAHLTLEKGVQAGRAKAFQGLVGVELLFDRHGDEDSCKAAPREPGPVAAPVTLRAPAFYTVSILKDGVREVGAFSCVSVQEFGEDEAWRRASILAKRVARMHPEAQPQVQPLYLAPPDYEAVADELAQWRKLKDPAVLHHNLLRGFPARLDARQLEHLGGSLF